MILFLALLLGCGEENDPTCDELCQDNITCSSEYGDDSKYIGDNLCSVGVVNCEKDIESHQMQDEFSCNKWGCLVDKETNQEACLGFPIHRQE